VLLNGYLQSALTTLHTVSNESKEQALSKGSVKANLSSYLNH